MIWVFALQLLLALSAIGLLRIHRVRKYLVAAAALAGHITMRTAEVIFFYLVACLVGVAIISAGFLLGLLARAIHLPEFGNFIITALFLVTAVALGIITSALTAITGAVANTVFRARQALAQASPSAREGLNWNDLFAKLREQFPDKKGLLDAVESAGQGWLANLFDTTGIRAILALPHTMFFDTIEAVTAVVGKMLHFVVAAVLWIAIAGFVAMWLPDSAHGVWVIAIPYGLLILLAIGAHKGDEWCRSHHLPDLWWSGYRVVRYGIRFAFTAVIFTAIYTTIDPPQTFSHWMVGIQTRFRVKEEQSAKAEFGQRYDQSIWRVIESGAGLRVAEHWYGDDLIPEKVQPNELLWRTEAPHWQFEDGGPYYAKYWRQTADLTMTPDPSNTIWFPESKVAAAGQLETRHTTLPKNTVVYQNNNGQPMNTVWHLAKPYAAEVTGNRAYIDGILLQFARLHDGIQTFNVWIRI